MPTPTHTPTQPTPAGIDIQAPAYPAPIGAKNTGISIHDWMAAMAMQGLLTHGMKVTADRALSDEEKDDELAQRAYKIAAAMLRTRAEAIKALE